MGKRAPLDRRPSTPSTPSTPNAPVAIALPAREWRRVAIGAAALNATEGIPALVAYRLASLQRETETVATDLGNAEARLQRHHIRKDAKGQAIPVRMGGVIVAGMYECEDQPTYEAEYDRLLNASTTLHLVRVSVDELERVGVTLRPDILANLFPVLLPPTAPASPAAPHNGGRS